MCTGKTNHTEIVELRFNLNEIEILHIINRADLSSIYDKVVFISKFRIKKNIL